MLNILGKILIAVSLCVQAYVLYTDNLAATAFNAKCTALLPYIPGLDLKTGAQILPYVRLAVVGLLGLSALMVVVRSSLIKLLVLTGLVLNLIIVYNPIKKVPGLN